MDEDFRSFRVWSAGFVARRGWFATAAAVVAAGALAACGSGSTQTTTAAPVAPQSRLTASVTPSRSAGTRTTPTPIGASAGDYPQTISTATGRHGTYLVGVSGRALYIWRGDSGRKSNCIGRCEQIWVPMNVLGPISVSGEARASDLSTESRGYGYTQVLYDGRPLYYFAGDPKSGTTHGEGRDGFGAKWWLLSPSGHVITTSR